MAKRCAPTEKQANGKCLLGYVHDPLAGIMNGGISGNAGVFTTADDVAILCAALQNGGEWNGHRILSPLAVKAMRTVPRARAEWGRALDGTCGHPTPTTPATSSRPRPMATQASQAPASSSTPSTT